MVNLGTNLTVEQEAVKAEFAQKIVDDAENGAVFGRIDATYTLRDTLANIANAPEGVVPGATSYAITEGGVIIEGAQTVAVAQAEVARLQGFVNGASNASSVIFAPQYEIADTLANIEKSLPFVEAAQSYALTNEPGDLGVLTKEQIAIVQGATDAEEYTWTQAGETFNLTTSADNIVGTAGDDVIEGGLTAQGQATYQTWDKIDGAEGVNTLNAAIAGGAAVGATLENIQIMNVQQTGVAGVSTLNLNGVSSLTELSLDGQGAGSGFTVNSLGSVASVTISDTTAANTLNFTAAALEPADQTLNVTLSGVTAGGLTLTDVGSNALETVAITSTGTANTLVAGLTTTGMGVTTLRVEGDQNLNLGAINDANATLKTIDAEGFLGNLTVTALSSSSVTGGEGNDTITTNGGGQNSVKGGLGNDTFDFNAGLATTDSIVGGEGTDSLNVAVGSVNAGVVYSNIEGVDAINLSNALAGTVRLANVEAGIGTLNIRGGGAASTGTVVFDGTLDPSAYTLNIGNNAATNSVQASLGGALGVQVAGSGTADSVTVNGLTYQTAAPLAAQNVFAGQAINATGVETLTLSTSQTVQGGVAAAVAQTIGPVTMTSTAGAATTLNISGNNATTVNVLTGVNSLNASGLTTNVAGGVSALTMTAGANSATKITGSAGADTLIANQNAATTIEGGAGNDSITGGAGNDRLFGQEGNDTITVVNATGGVLADGGLGDDTVTMTGAAVRSTSSIIGGEGTDTLQLTAVGANITAANAVGVSGFENLEVQGAATVALDMSGFVNNSFSQINVDNTVTNVLTLNNVSSNVNTLGLLAGSQGDSTVFVRQVDTGTDALTIKNTTGVNLSATGLGAVTAITANNEETITINTTGVTATGASQDGNVTITTLNAADLTTLNVQGAANVEVSAIAGAVSLATVNASGLSGTLTANAASSNANLTFTGALGGNNFTSGVGNDSLTGSAVNDILNGGANRDSINGAGGVDRIIGSTGADQVTGGAGVDTFVQNLADSVALSANTLGATVAVGNTMTFANGVDVVTDAQLVTR